MARNKKWAMRKLRHDEIPRPDPKEVALLPRHPISIVLNNVRSIYNVGSIFRTSDAALIEHVYITGYTGTPDHRSLHKTALGAQETVPWSYHRDPVEVLTALRSKGYALAVLEITDSPKYADDLQLDHFPLALVLGNEVTGVDDVLVEMADLAIEIPQFGAKQSLNVSVAYGIAVFDLVRRYRKLHEST
jgi:tRNA G18 (ribose-2'-O)-methylase SpoU